MIGETMLLAVPVKAFGTIRRTFRLACQEKQGGIMNTGVPVQLEMEEAFSR